MKKLVSFLLAAVLMAAFVPMAVAQRSLSNPEEAFVMPEMNSVWTFQRDTWNAGIKIAGSLLGQLYNGKGDPQEIMRLMEQAPLLKADDDLPPEEKLDWADMADILLKKGLRDIYVALLETQWENIYQVIAIYSSRKGEVNWYASEIGYNSETGLFFDLNNKSGLFGLGYEYEAGEFLIRTSALESWHRRLGYHIFFDMLAPVSGTNIDTLRFPFEYNGRDYMVQIWKGIYFLFANGAEIGIYEKPKGRPIFWDSLDTEMDISMKVYRDGEMLFDYGTQHSWWLGGFRIGPPYAQAASRNLGMTGSIAFEDPAMLEAFLASFEKNKDSKITGKAQGMVFSFEWGPVG